MPDNTTADDLLKIVLAQTGVLSAIIGLLISKSVLTKDEVAAKLDHLSD